MNVSIVIPNYNGENLLKKTLPRILEACKGKEIIIVDDASTDESVRTIQDIFPQVICVKHLVNKGFSSSVNTGVSHASGTHVFLLNSDAYPVPGWEQIAARHFLESQVFAVGCMQLSKEGKDIVHRGRGVGRFQRGFLIHQNGTEPAGNPHTTLWVSGGAGIFRKDIWEKLGGMCELYNPFYWEDIDLSYRAVKSGYDIRFEESMIVHHEQSEGSIRTSYTQRHILSISYRNQYYFMWINITSFFLLLSHVLWMPYHMISAFIRSDMSFFLGFFSAVFSFPFVMKERLCRVPMWTKTDARLEVS